MRNYIVETSKNQETGKTKARGFDTLEEAVAFADTIEKKTGDFPTIRVAVYRTVTPGEIKAARR